MKKEILRKYLPALLLASLLLSGCTTTGANPEAAANKEMTAPAKETAAPAAQVKAEAKPEANKNVYMGKVVGKSNKAKQISIEQDNGTTVMLSFGDNTTGLEHAVEGHASIVSYEMRDGKPFALDIKQKLAKIPEGTSIIEVEELKGLIDKGENFLLVDSRPGARYSESHLPGAISIPVCEMQELLQNLPTDKNKLLIFYCGGPT
ncbi:MAG: rhodanese-like domain-containing protein [Desulfobulbaceae bacterium]|jgi:hypothetical protein|nr:rhodanese-like domain-containing protein [Desulfobulbaceae bacterium]